MTLWKQEPPNDVMSYSIAQLLLFAGAPFYEFCRSIGGNQEHENRNVDCVISVQSVDAVDLKVPVQLFLLLDVWPVHQCGI